MGGDGKILREQKASARMAGNAGPRTARSGTDDADMNAQADIQKIGLRKIAAAITRRGSRPHHAPRLCWLQELARRTKEHL